MQNRPPLSTNEPDVSFEYAWYKLQRANEHIVNLKELCEAFIGKNPPQVLLEANFETRCLNVIFNPPNYVDIRIPLVAGDAAHNIRAALDYCWMGVFRALDGPKAKKQTFPFANGPEGLEATVNKTLEDLPIEGLKEIVLEKAKTYPEGNPLLVAINRMDNRDKHNLIILCPVATTVIHLDLRSPKGRTATLKNCKIISGRAVCPVVLSHEPDDLFELNGDPQIASDIAVMNAGPLDGDGVIPTLGGALHKAADIVKAFADTFGSGRSVAIKNG
jgi:hypothetical protein